MDSQARLARLLGATLVVCACGEPTPPQVASPLGLESLGSVAPLDVVRLTASGGRPPYAFTLSLAASGGTVSGSLYHVGEVGAVADELRVTDAAGATALLRVAVGPALDVGPLLRELDSAATLEISPTGGAPPYRCDLSSSGGGRLLSDGACHYRAGLVRGEDRLRVSDANGVTRTVRLLVGQVFAVSPEAAQVAPGEQRILGAYGGARRYRFALEASPSGATIDTHTGVYVAGPTGEVTDVARVTDGEGQAKVLLQVGSSLSVSPAEASVDPSRSLDLALKGGKPPYRLELVSPSGGSLEPIADGAVYTAGPTGGVTDVITAVDAVGTQARAVLTVRLGPRFAPAVADVAPRETLELTLLATTGVASFRMAQAQSGGSVAPIGDTRALYTAGVSGLTQDVVEATGPWGYPIRAILRVGPALALTPDLLSLPSGAQVTLTASGGKAPYRFSLVSPSRGQLFTGGAAASYFAGPTAGVTDEVTVKDALGTERVASLEVLPGPHFAATELYVAPLEGLELEIGRAHV